MEITLANRVRETKRMLELTVFVATVLGGYVFTVGIVPAVFRHMGDSGRLQWLPSIPGAIPLLDAYEWPARELSRIRACQQVFEFSASIWWTLLAPPDTTA